VYFVFYEANKELAMRAEHIKERFISSQKEVIKSEIERTAEKIASLRSMYNETVKKSLKNRVSNAESVIKTFSDNPDKYFLLTNVLGSVKWDDDYGYYYIIDNNGKILFHGGNTAYVGKNIISLGKVNDSVNLFFNELKKNGEYFGTYDWLKPHSDNKDLYPKVCYAKFIPKENYYIAAASYLDFQEEQVKKQVKNALSVERFGVNDYGYFFAMDEKYNTIIHPFPKKTLGASALGTITKDGKNLADILINAVESGNGYVEYLWELPGRNVAEKKISYVSRIPGWNWIIGTGFYFNDFDTYLKKERESLNKMIIKDFTNFAGVFGIMLISTLMISLYITKYIKNVESARKRELHMLEQYKLVLDNSSIVSKADTKGIINYVNDKFCETTLYSKEDVIGKSHNIERHPSTPKETFRALWDTISSGKVWHGVLKNKKADGSSYYKSATIVPLKDENGNILEYISSGQDITEFVEQSDRLDNIFSTDTLTGLGSRIKLLEDIESSNSPSLALLDVDRFSRINDIYGNSMGDKILKDIATTIFRRVRNRAYSTYRVYADTFAILCDNTVREEFIEEVKGAISHITEEAFHAENDEILLNIRSGIAYDSSEVLAYADMALNTAKAKNMEIYIYDPEDNQLSGEYKKDIVTIKKIYSALKDDRIFPVFQPIYNYATKQIDKYECLMRIMDETGEMMTPNDFIEISKKTRIYPRLTLQIVEKSVRKFNALPYEFSINLTLEDLLNTDTMEYLNTYIKSNDVADRLVIEIVETEELENYDQILDTLKELKKAGVKIAIDDFGSGYSSFEYLIKLNADFIKIDAGIIRHMLDDDRALGIVKSIVAFAKQSGMKTIAEFISSEELFDAAGKLGVDYAQGYHVGKPLPELI
jgi:PAS domain S-box-containing protein/diguanylate cyclase (GGDEF)-like protein